MYVDIPVDGFHSGKKTRRRDDGDGGCARVHPTVAATGAANETALTPQVNSPPSVEHTAATAADDDEAAAAAAAPGADAVVVVVSAAVAEPRRP